MKKNANHQHIADPEASSIHDPFTHLKSLTLTVLTPAHEKRHTFYPYYHGNVNETLRQQMI